MGESGDERGDGQPHHPPKIQHEPPKHVRQTTKDEQGGRDDEGQGCGWPN